VRLIGNERAGRIEVAYNSREELDRLVELIVVTRAIGDVDACPGVEIEQTRDRVQ
jgi:hypothetical protein